MSSSDRRHPNGVLTAPNAESMAKPWLREIFRQETRVDYYEGEKID
jgi:hypothetical protein